MATKRTEAENLSIRIEKQKRVVADLVKRIATAKTVVTESEPRLVIEQARLKHLKSTPLTDGSTLEVDPEDAATEQAVAAEPEATPEPVAQDAWA